MKLLPKLTTSERKDLSEALGVSDSLVTKVYYGLRSRDSQKGKMIVKAIFAFDRSKKKTLKQIADGASRISEGGVA